MGALLPTLQAEHLREGLTDYLATTFALTDPDAQSALTDFVGDPDTGMFKGPYVRLRLPFAPGRRRLGRAPGLVAAGLHPVRHQAARVRAAVDQAGPSVRSRRWSPPAPGRARPRRSSTRSSTTCCARERRGVTGMKALILYPMNALANDQAERLAELHRRRPRAGRRHRRPLHRRAVRRRRTRVSPDGLITDRARHARRAAGHPAHQLQDARPAAAAPRPTPTCGGCPPTALQYLVLDEFHTYDGAQGTDVAMLLRRLGLTLKSHWTDDVAGHRRGPRPSARPDHPGRDVGDARRRGRRRRRCSTSPTPCSARRSPPTR